MNAPIDQPAQPAPNFVTCHCQHCDGGIEFDANELTAENSTFPCPHCGLQTQLSMPKAAESLPPPSAEEIPVSHLQKAAKLSLKSPRVTLTKAQYASPTGQRLINLFVEIGDDGIVTEEEVRRLQRWLADNANSDIPAADFLARLVERVLSDGKVTQDEAFEIQLALERVLPKDIRNEMAEKRREAWHNSPASDNQREYICGLGGKPPPILTRAEASKLIEQLSPKATERQLDYIRGLGGHAPAGITRADASALIEQLLGGGE
jgi:hypothetical protein